MPLKPSSANMSRLSKRCTLLALAALIAGAGCAGNSDPQADGPAGPDRGIVFLRYMPGSESTEQREAGFIETLYNDFPQVTVISSKQFAGPTAESALEKSQQLLLRLGERATGVFCPNESSADGMYRALDEAGLLGRVPFVGFDPNS